MLHKVIDFTTTTLNEHLTSHLGFPIDTAISSNITDTEGNISVSSGENKLVVSIVHVEQEFNRAASTVNTRMATVRKLDFNIYIMISSFFSPREGYLEGLSALSGVLNFFQESPVFSHETNPTLDKGIDKIVYEYHNIDFLKLSNIWGLHGGKYHPSLLFKVRAISFTSENVLPVGRISGLAGDFI